MAAFSSSRFLVPLAVGLALGATGAVLFLQSMAGEEGSAEEQVRRLEVELQHAKNRLAALEASQGAPQNSTGLLARIANPQSRRELTDGTRQLAEDIRAGRPVSPDDIFRASQPLLRDLAPLFDRMRIKEQRSVIDAMTGELTRKYRLSPEDQTELKNWFQQKAEQNAEEWNALLARKGTSLLDLARASRTMRIDADLDSFLPGLLDPKQQAEFAAERMAARDKRVQAEADQKVQQLNAITSLDELQRDQIFGIIARSSRDYDASMILQGSQGQVISTAPVTDRESAILSVLRPDQRKAYLAEQDRRRAEAAKDMEAIGLTLPANWHMFEEDSF